jgi:hypothetical protein
MKKLIFFIVVSIFIENSSSQNQIESAVSTDFVDTYTSKIIFGNIVSDTINNIEYNYNVGIINFENVEAKKLLFEDKAANKHIEQNIFDTTFQKLDNLKKFVKKENLVSDILFDALFNFNIINLSEVYDDSGKDTIIADDIINNTKPHYKSRENYLKKAKKHFKLYDIGNINLSNQFQSKVVLMTMKQRHYQSWYNLFLVNIKDNVIKSVTIITYYLGVKNSGYIGNMYLISLPQGLYTHYNYDKYNVSKTGSISQKNYEKTKIDYFPIFYFDDDGFVKILENCYIVPFF